MIRAVVVDDERLVREGFMSFIDWMSYGIEIVGEAGDGQSALVLLEQTDAELLFVDMLMPGMSGFELIRQARRLRPELQFVALTCHQGFDYVQEALRLGALDYVVKTLLDKEEAERTIARLSVRLNWEEARRSVAARSAGLDGFRETDVQAMLAFCSLVEGEDGSDLLLLPIVSGSLHALLQAGGLWLLPVDPTDETVWRRQARRLGRQWLLAYVTGLGGLDLPMDTIKQTLAAHIPGLLFYSGSREEALRVDYSELHGRAYSEVSLALSSGIPLSDAREARPQPSRLKAERAGLLAGYAAALAVQERTGGQAVERAALAFEAGGCVPDSGERLRWTLYVREWETFIGAVEQQRTAPARLEAFGRMLCQQWSGLLIETGEASQLAGHIAGLRTWSEWSSWLCCYADAVKRTMLRLGMTREIMLCLIDAIRYMRRHAGDKIRQTDVARHVNMSRSYFSRCFAKLVGRSFGEELRNMRIERAKELLLQSSAPIYEIAAASGFVDDKYFSRLFREHVGQLPSDYRLNEQ